jgi:hypothetical protein
MTADRDSALSGMLESPQVSKEVKGATAIYRSPGLRRLEQENENAAEQIIMEAWMFLSVHSPMTFLL